jgi:Na+-driven multidrug efflux pump
MQYQIDILKQAFPASLNMFCVGAGFFIIIFFASFFPSPDTSSISVASYGIAIRIEQIILMPAIGLNFACLALTGQNFGAVKYDRIREGYLICLKYGLILMVCGSLFLYFGAGYFMKIFTDDIPVINTGIHYLQIAALFAPILPVLNISIALMQGVKKPIYTVFISLFKEVVGAVIIIWLLCFYLNYKLQGLWVGILIVNYLSVIIFLFIVNNQMKSLGLEIFRRKLPPN